MSSPRGNALTREVVEVRRKDLDADPRRLSNREKTLPSDRLHPTYSLNSMRIGILREDNAGKHSRSPNLLPYFWQNACIGECTLESQEGQYQWLFHRGPNSSRRFLTGNSTFHQEKIPIRGWPFRAGYHPTHAFQQFRSNRCWAVLHGIYQRSCFLPLRTQRIQPENTDRFCSRIN